MGRGQTARPQSLNITLGLQIKDQIARERAHTSSHTLTHLKPVLMGGVTSHVYIMRQYGLDAPFFFIQTFMVATLVRKTILELQASATDKFKRPLFVI